MNLLVIGSGAREHTLVWKLAQSASASRIFCAPGNPGIFQIAERADVPVEGDFSAIVNWARENAIDLVVVGPEDPLGAGIVDRFEAAGIRAFGPTAAAARLESSKAFAKDVMRAAGVPTAHHKSFGPGELADALAYAESLGAPLVIKADGLTAGKGVTVALSPEEAREAIAENLESGRFGAASASIVIEEFLEGEEASVFAFCDGVRGLVTQSAQDHKAIFDDDRGPNTGGMGAYSPAPVCGPAMLAEVERLIVQPTIDEMARRGCPFRGFLYVGLMIGPQGPKVIEFNCRFGDPEAQVVLPRLENDLLEVIEACLSGGLEDVELKWTDEAAVCVVMASGGYPGEYAKGVPIEGLGAIPHDDRTMIFQAGMRSDGDRLLTNGGRVLGLTTMDASLKKAIERNYELISRIRFEGAHYRTDIGRKALDRTGGR